MRRIKIAQIGTSRFSHGNQIWNSLNKQTDVFDVVGYAFPENERKRFSENAKDFAGAREMSVEEILNDPEIEAVTVETEEAFLTKYALQVTEHGKHVHMEKPGSPDLQSFRALLNAVEKKKTVLQIGYMYRHNPMIQDLLRCVREGELGTILSVEAQMSCYHEADFRAWQKEQRGGMMFFLGCHLIDLILQIQGKPIAVIPCNRSTEANGGNDKNFGLVLLDYGHGISFAKTTSSEVGGFCRRQLVVSGTKKTVELRPLEILKKDGIYTKATEHRLPDRWKRGGRQYRSDRFDRYDGMMLAFAETITGKRKNTFDSNYEWMLFQTLMSASELTSSSMLEP